ncbi:MAG: C25 family cysteine peptidase, partial [bacterium]
EGENCFTLDGAIEENDKLKEVRMTVYWEDQSVVHNVSFSGSAPLFYFGHNTLKCMLNEGDNYINIQAADYAGLTDTKSVKVTYAPLNQESELLIVTPWELRPALLSLSDHKNNTGIPTSIISVEAIADDPRFFHMDDLPGMIKLAISYAYKNYNCRYVMLVGDSDKFPVRYCRLPDPNSNGSFAPSDLYYADLYKGDGSFDNWDSNGNGYYGEINMIWGSSSTYSDIFIDKVHMRPDIALGRLPASSYSEAAIYCDKVIAYESANYKHWFDEILLLTGDPGYNSDEATNDWIAANCLTGFIKTEYYYSQNTGTQNDRAAQINNYLNQGVGFVCFVGHGTPYGYSGIYDCFTHMPGLNNADRLPIFFSAACDTAMFHTLHGDYQDIHGNDPPYPPGYWEGNVPEPAAIQPTGYDRDSFAEELLVKDPNGAIGYIGCYTGSQAGGLILAKYFFESYDHLKPTGDIAGEPVTLGRMWNWALNEYFDNQCHYTIDLISTWYAPTMVHHAQKYLLFGDPSLRLAE